MMIGDAWLFDLALEGQKQFKTASLCFLCQALVFCNTKHILALNDERSRTAIRLAATLDRVPHTIVRCLRCGEQAWFLDWWTSVIPMTPEREALLAAYRESVSSASLGFATACRGDDDALGMFYLIGG